MDETQRVETAKKYKIAETPGDAAFDHITHLAAVFLKVPVAAISFVDGAKIWFKSAQGMSFDQFHRDEDSLFTHVLDSGEFLEINDTLADLRSRHHPLMKGPQGVRFFAAAPIVVSEGVTLGSLCVMHSQPRRLDAEEREMLTELAGLVVTQLETLRSVNEAFLKEVEMSNTLQAILDNTSDNIILLDANARVLSINRLAQNTLLRLRGREVLVGDNYRAHLAPQSAPLFNRLFESALNGKAVEAEAFTTSLVGSGWFHYRAAPVYVNDNSLLGVLYTATSIDEAKKAEIALVNKAAELEAILDNTTDSIVLLGADYQVMLMNREAAEILWMFGGREAKIGDDFRNHLSRENEEIFFQTFRKAIGGETVELERYINSATGSGWFHFKMAPVYDSHQALLGVVFTIKDINERKEAEIALQQSEEKFRKIVESATSPILIVNRRMEIVLVNPGVQTVFGYRPQELIDKSIDILIPSRFEEHNMESRYRYFKRAGSKRMGVDRYVPAVKKDGKEILIEASLNTFSLGEEDFVLIILQDVTQRIRSEERIRAQVEKLKAIAWHQSHEVRQPLVNILGFIDLIKRESQQGYNESYLEHLEQAAKELDEVVHKIVQYTIEKN